jgi:hypothetical protein
MYPCDRFIEQYDAIYYRGVTIPATMPTPRMDQLVKGMMIRNRLELVDFEKDKHITVLLTHKLKSSKFKYFD